MDKRKLQSARINSGCIIRNNQKFQVNSGFITQQKIGPEIFEKILQEECPTFVQYKQRPKTPATFQQKSYDKLPRKGPSLDLQRFHSKKKEFLQESQIKLKDYLYGDKRIERRYYKLYKRTDKEYFSHLRKKSQPQIKDIARDMPTYRKILEQNQDQNIAITQNKHQEKKMLEIQEEEKEEKEYMKAQLEKYMIEEQKYFNQLDTIQQKGFLEFQNSIQLKNKYSHHYVDQPKMEYVERKDLILNVNQKQEPNELFTQISHALQKRPILQLSNFSSFQHIPSSISLKGPVNSPVRRQNTLSAMLQPQIQQQDYVMEQSIPNVKVPLSYQTKEVQQLFRDITLNKKTDVICQIISKPELINTQDSNGQGILHIAILRGRNGLAKHFIRNGLSIYQQDNRGRTPEMIAKQFNNVKILDFVKYN